MGSGGIPPPASSGLGVRRVHKTPPSGIGSPDAKPKENGYADNFGVAATAPRAGGQQRGGGEGGGPSEEGAAEELSGV